MDHTKLIEALKGYRKIVINSCHGGFGLSGPAKELYSQLSGTKDVWDNDIARDDPFLVQTVEQLGDAANGAYAELRIVEIPADVEWTVEEYDGSEWIAEKHRTWR
jgi:hypothetical protein